MKKSNQILLMLVTVSVFSQFCSQKPAEKKRLFIRADTMVGYTPYRHTHGTYVHFYSFGSYYDGAYHRTGYYNSRTYQASTQHNTPIARGEGANITLYKGGKPLHESGGEYGSEGFIFQELAELPNFDNYFPVIGSWIVGQQPAGMGIRESDSPITNDKSRFIPHFIETM